MDYANYLKKYQEVPFKIFLNALENNKLFHAYLLVGEIGTPLLDVSKFLAASIIDPTSSPFSNLDNIVSEKVMNESYEDLVVLDTKKKPIKIDDIRNLEERFYKTGINKIGKKVYIINCVENLGIDSVNALLKFLEEPSDNTYAFLTTESETRVLPTIKSRTQIIHFSLLESSVLIKKAVELAANPENAQILSFFYNDEHVILEKEKDEQFLLLKEITINLLSNINDKLKFKEVLLNEALKNVKDKIAARYFFDFIILFFKEAVKYKYSKETDLENYVKIIKDLSNVKNLEDSILTLMNSRNEINYNVNLNLLIINVLLKVFGE